MRFFTCANRCLDSCIKRLLANLPDECSGVLTVSAVTFIHTGTMSACFHPHSRLTRPQTYVSNNLSLNIKLFVVQPLEIQGQGFRQTKYLRLVELRSHADSRFVACFRRTLAQLLCVLCGKHLRGEEAVEELLWGDRAVAFASQPETLLLDRVLSPPGSSRQLAPDSQSPHTTTRHPVEVEGSWAFSKHSLSRFWRFLLLGKPPYLSNAIEQSA